jgi:hypothetical protein
MFALLLLGVAGAVDVPSLPAPMPPAGVYKPFDLTYMPGTARSVLAVRPNELIQHLGGQEKATATMIRRLLAAAFAFLDGDLKAAAPPELADIEQLIVEAKINLHVEKDEDGRGNFSVGGVSAGLIRTAKPFDWSRCLKMWFPKAESVKHAGRKYLRVPIELGKEPQYLALFVADDRTLTFDTTESEIKSLLTRLEKEEKPTAPAGWESVNRELVALCFDTTAEGWLVAPEKPKREIDQSLVTVARKTTSLAVGFSVGDQTTLQVLAAVRDSEDVKPVQKAIKALVGNLAGDDDTDPAVAKFLSRASVNREGKVVRLIGSASGDLLRRLLDPDAER